MNSTTAVAAEAMVNLALTATAVVEIMAKWLKMYPRTVCNVDFFAIKYNEGCHKLLASI